MVGFFVGFGVIGCLEGLEVGSFVVGLVALVGSEVACSAKRKYIGNW